ncbi:nucleotidyltransferase family protein [Mucilaginibacter panaciglaebae]|uniref:Nucleotidyltransferase family protein n=1 Tax=Mucilaginibacter panaciglaebae TaxID=502331 RepID=A0ABP7WNE0_9SPHI
MFKADNFQEIIISPQSTILASLKRMDTIRRKLLLVFDNRYAGLLSIGDIQRAIIKGINLETPIIEILRGDYITATPESTVEQIKNSMLVIRAEFMPVVTEEGEIKAVYFWKDLFETETLLPVKQFNLPVVIMAGGLGTRLKPITNVLPKPLIPIGTKTIIEEIFEQFGKHGCNEFYISVNYKAEFIKSYIHNLGLPYQVDFFEEDIPLGTAGSLTLLKDTIKTTFIVSNCDILIDQDYSEILEYHRENNNEITVVAVLKHFPIAYGIIETGENGQLLNMKEKPELTFKINSGMYILEANLLNEIPEESFFHITELIQNVTARNGKVGVFPISDGAWNDIGDWPEYKKVLMNNGFII